MTILSDLDTATIHALLIRRRDLTELVKSFEEERDTINAQLMEHVARAPDEKMEVDGWKLSMVRTVGRKTLSPERLLMQGVSPAVIEAATVQGDPGKPYVRISPPKGE